MIGWQYLSGYHEHAALPFGLGMPLISAIVLTVLVTAVASLRHVRQALALQPVEALG